MGYRKIELDCASVQRCARSRGKPRHLANFEILRDKNSVLILSIIVVAVFSGQGSIYSMYDGESVMQACQTSEQPQMWKKSSSQHSKTKWSRSWSEDELQSSFSRVDSPILPRYAFYTFLGDQSYLNNRNNRSLLSVGPRARINRKLLQLVNFERLPPPILQTKHLL